MSSNKLQVTDENVASFLNGVAHPTRQADAIALDGVFQKVTGFEPRMWGDAMIGYGRYDYTYKSGRTGTCFATGFSPRKSNIAIHIMPGYADFSAMLDRLGKHKKAVSCLYINKLADVDVAVLEEIIHAGLVDLAQAWPVLPE